MDVWQRGESGWQPIGSGIPVHIGRTGWCPSRTTVKWRPRWVSSVSTLRLEHNRIRGRASSTSKVTRDYWWDGDMNSPTYNTMQVCKKADCAFNTDPSSGTENLYIPHSTRMRLSWASTRPVSRAMAGILRAHHRRRPDGGLRGTGRRHPCQDHAKWLRPGAVIAVAK